MLAKIVIEQAMFDAINGLSGLPCSLSHDRVPGSGVTEPAEGALRVKEDGHRGSWLTLSWRT